MAEYKFNFPDECPCSECGHPQSIEVSQCPECGTTNLRLNAYEFWGEIEQKRVIDARYGGFIIGRNSKDDDIPMFNNIGDGIFNLCGLMQGGEYLLSAHATAKHHDRLNVINSEKGTIEPFLPKVTVFSSIINANFIPKNGGLWINRGQYVINRYATQKHYEELEELNALSFEEHQFTSS